MKHNIPTQHDDNKLKSILNGYPSVVPSSGEQASYENLVLESDYTQEVPHHSIVYQDMLQCLILDLQICQNVGIIGVWSGIRTPRSIICPTVRQVGLPLPKLSRFHLKHVSFMLSGCIFTCNNSLSIFVCSFSLDLPFSPRRFLF